MNLDEFKSYSLSSGSIDYDGKFGCQCVDLVREYIRKVFPTFQQPFGKPGAKDWYFDYSRDPRLNEQFEKYPNVPDFIPQAGDIVIWNAHPKNGMMGHIAIVLPDANIRVLPVLEQNYIPYKVGIRNDSYQNCLGFLRAKEE